MLDPRGKKEIIDLVHLLRFNQKDLTIFSITHDPEEAYLSEFSIKEKLNIMIPQKMFFIIMMN